MSSVKIAFVIVIIIFAQQAFSQVPCPVAKLLASDPHVRDNFGHSIDAAGDVMAVGAVGVSDRVAGGGAVYVYRRSGGEWRQESKLYAFDTSSNDGLGFPAVVDEVTRGQRIVASAGANECRGAGFSCGAAYPFHFVDGQWRSFGKLQPPDLQGNDAFGTSLAIQGDVLVVGAERHDFDIGAAYVFEFSGTEWSQTAKLTPDEPTELFGSSVAIDGEWIIVGALGDDQLERSAGAAFVFRRVGSTWQKVQRLTASVPRRSALFGFELAILGRRALISAPGSPGEVFAFDETEGVWSETARLEPSRGTPDDGFGHTVELRGDVAVIAAPLDGEAGLYEGAVYVYRKLGASWIEEGKILPPQDPLLSEGFGFFLTLTDDSLIISPGIDDEAGEAAGAAFVYLRGEVLAGNVGTGGGSSATDVLFVNGSVGDDCRRVRVSAGESTSLTISRSPGTTRGAYAVWILDGARGAGAPIQLRKGGVTYDLGTGIKCLPANNTVSPDSCPCPLTFPVGWTSQSVGASERGGRLCLSPIASPASPTTLSAIFPAGNFLIGGLVEDPNSINSPALNVSIANWIAVSAR